MKNRYIEIPRGNQGPAAGILTSAGICLTGHFALWRGSIRKGHQRAAVGLVNLQRGRVHVKIVLFRHPGEKRDRAGFMIDGINVLSIREHADILGIFTAYRQNNPLIQESCGGIPVINPDAVVPCIGTEHQLFVAGKSERGRRVDIAVLEYTDR